MTVIRRSMGEHQVVGIKNAQWGKILFQSLILTLFLYLQFHEILLYHFVSLGWKKSSFLHKCLETIMRLYKDFPTIVLGMQPFFYVWILVWILLDRSIRINLSQICLVVWNQHKSKFYQFFWLHWYNLGRDISYGGHIRSPSWNRVKVAAKTWFGHVPTSLRPHVPTSPRPQPHTQMRACGTNVLVLFFQYFFIFLYWLGQKSLKEFHWYFGRNDVFMKSFRFLLSFIWLIYIFYTTYKVNIYQVF